MTWAIFLAYIYLGLKSGLGESVIWKLMGKGGEIGIMLKLRWSENVVIVLSQSVIIY